ncbi:MAG: STAS domain-containing protein [Gammaproteobacteria bacterium]|nr:STAS domain-containing protein [Gammaproteobacteria bacterium]
MSFKCSEHLNYNVLHLTGEVDLSNSSEVRKRLLELLEENKGVIVDFSELDYIDSSGMATLVEGLNLAKKNSLPLVIAAANGAPLQVLELTRLNQVFTMIDSVEDIEE